MNTKFDVDDIVWVKAKVSGISSFCKDCIEYSVEVVCNIPGKKYVLTTVQEDNIRGAEEVENESIRCNQ